MMEEGMVAIPQATETPVAAMEGETAVGVVILAGEATAEAVTAEAVTVEVGTRSETA